MYVQDRMRASARSVPRISRGDVTVAPGSERSDDPTTLTVPFPAPVPTATRGR